MIRRAFRLSALALAGLLLLAAARIVAGKLAGPYVLARAEREFALHVGPLEIEAWVPAPLPAEENGALALWQATAAIRPWPGERPPTLPRLLAEGAAPDRKLLAEAGEWVARNREAITALRRLVDFPGAEFPGWRTLEVVRVWLETGRDPRRFFLPHHLLLMDAGLALRASDWNRALEDLAAMRAITVMLRQEPILILHSLSGTFEEQTLAVAHATLRAGGQVVAPGVAAELAALAAAPDLRHGLAGETLLARNGIRQLVEERRPSAHRHGGWPDLFEPSTADHYVAGSLAATTRVVRGMPIPAPRWPAHWTNPPELWPQLVALLWPLAPAPATTVPVQVIGFQMVEAEQYVLSSRRLGLIATRLTSRSSEAPPLADLPGGEAPLLWSDEPPRIERRADGGWTVSAPAGIRKVWVSYREEGSIPRSRFESRERLLYWEVPASPPPSEVPPSEVPGELPGPAP
jgi:hypothetical protein